MVTLLDNVQFSKQLVLYVLMVSLVRGIAFPDFRYDMVSIVLIQVIYPVALFAPMIMRLHGEHFWSYYFLCLGGIVIAALVGLLRYYLEAGKENVTEQVSVAIFSLSFVAQIGLLSALVILLSTANKIKEI
ncbi:MAG: hypothetical protein OQL11_07805 [Gammaproteobacteria bacterium]|nr:hypothetical protein [Gammaproteobacteria bacterium]